MFCVPFLWSFHILTSIPQRGVLHLQFRKTTVTTEEELVFVLLMIIRLLINMFNLLLKQNA